MEALVLLIASIALFHFSTQAIDATQPQETGQMVFYTSGAIIALFLFVLVTAATLWGLLT